MTTTSDTAPGTVEGRALTASALATNCPDTWYALLESNAQEAPDDVALIDGERSLTHAELLNRVRSLIGGFSELGVAQGQIVAVWLPNCIEWVETAAALAALGATALGVNTKLRSYDVQGLLARADCDLLVTSPHFKGIDFMEMLLDIHADDPAAVRLVIAVPDPSKAAVEPDSETTPQASPFETVDYLQLFAASPQGPRTHNSDSLASAFTSSGSTGVPKIIMHTQAGLLGHSAAVAAKFGYSEDAVVLASLPLCGVFGLNTLMAALTVGRPTVLQAVFDPPGTLELIEQHGVTHTNMSDAMLAMTLDAVDDPARIDSLREVGFGNFTATDVRGLIDRGRQLGKKFFQTYGSSEVQALMCYPPDDADADRMSQGGGVPVSPRTHMRIALSGAAAAANRTDSPHVSGEAGPPPDETGSQQGEIEVRGPFVSPGRITEHGYEDTPVDDEGWFATGDLGYKRSKDDVVYLTRMGDVLRLGGFLVAPREVEDLLIGFRGIAEAQFVAAHTDRGLVPVAFVILEPEHADSFDESGVIAECSAVLARFKVPRRIIPLHEFPTLRGANGDKIQRNRLREMAEETLRGE